MVKVLVLYHSMYGHVETMANAVAEGAAKVAGVEVSIKRVPETMPTEAFKAAGGLWAKGQLFGKVASVFASTGTGGGQEMTITSTWTTLAHHGMTIVPIGYGTPELFDISKVSGGTPYGATTLAGGDGSRQPDERELAIARFQGEHVAKITASLKG